MDFFKDIGQSIYGPKYYGHLIHEPKGWKYYWLFALAVSLIVTVYASFMVLPKITAFVSDFYVKAVAYIPNELEMTFNKGRLTTNVKEPYLISIPLELNQAKKEEGPANFLYIDTKSSFTIEKFNNANTLIYLSSDGYAARGSGGQIRVGAFTSVPDGTVLNKAKILPIIEKVYSLLKGFAIPGFIFGVLFASLFSFVMLLVPLVFYALIVWLILKVRKISPRSFGQSYMLSLHLVTLPVLIFILEFVIPPLHRLPKLFTILFVIMAIANLQPKHAKGGLS